MKSLISALSEVDCMKSHFLDLYVMDTEGYYAEEAARLSKSMSPSGYLEHCDERLAEEESRISALIGEPHCRLVIHAVEKALLST